MNNYTQPGEQQQSWQSAPRKRGIYIDSERHIMLTLKNGMSPAGTALSLRNHPDLNVTVTDVSDNEEEEFFRYRFRVPDGCFVRTWQPDRHADIESGPGARHHKLYLTRQQGQSLIFRPAEQVSPEKACEDLQEFGIFIYLDEVVSPGIVKLAIHAPSSWTVVRTEVDVGRPVRESTLMPREVSELLGLPEWKLRGDSPESELRRLIPAKSRVEQASLLLDDFFRGRMNAAGGRLPANVYRSFRFAQGQLKQRLEHMNRLIRHCHEQNDQLKNLSTRFMEAAREALAEHDYESILEEARYRVREEQKQALAQANHQTTAPQPYSEADTVPMVLDLDNDEDDDYYEDENDRQPDFNEDPRPHNHMM
ncbi:hypothetical protein [Pelagibaculum spongiae]|uniref:Uncharacterized protein n=1 Tax=Pelagibaculum spongiae TaxID=2080658 RepID=A0A2V1GYT9_9GAMM|nr:hypothetical protein [Pelagibaculum spongiae]PVZ66299.1 hypothetical protein DC094_16490 [Pelagibaculum spongiae]